MGCYEEMNMVWHDFLFYQGNSFLLCYQFMQLMQVFSDLASQHFSSVLHRPYEMVIHVVYASPRAHPMLLFRHSNLYIWSPHVYIPIDRYGLYPTTEVAGISPDSVLKFISALPGRILFLLLQNLFMLERQSYLQHDIEGGRIQDKVVSVFTDEEISFVNNLITLGFRRKTANVLAYLLLVGEGTSYEIETATGLRQPETSTGLKELGVWLTTTKVPKSHTRKYALTSPKDAIASARNKLVEARKAQDAAYVRICQLVE